ncbi:MAG: 30S ribosome-binding factor RbfA [Phycisphaerales bacterium]|nr:30S ribosome-binding factor RbfA [Phycisphaerales bacterium]
MALDEIEFDETESGEPQKPARERDRKPRAPRVKGPPRLVGNAMGIDLGPGFEERASNRPLQFASYIRREVQLLLSAGLNDPRVQGMISVTEVLLTPDLLEARIKVSVMPADRERLTLSGLRSAAGHLRLRILHEGRLGRIPQLCFEIDERLKKGAALEELIRGTGVSSAHVENQTAEDSPESLEDEGADAPHVRRTLPDRGTLHED